MLAKGTQKWLSAEGRQLRVVLEHNKQVLLNEGSTEVVDNEFSEALHQFTFGYI